MGRYQSGYTSLPKTHHCKYNVDLLEKNKGFWECRICHKLYELIVGKGFKRVSKKRLLLGDL